MKKDPQKEDNHILKKLKKSSFFFCWAVLGIDNFVHNIETASKYFEFFGSFFEACCCLWILSRIGTLFQNIFWFNVKNHCSSHWAKNICKIMAERQEFSKYLSSLKEFLKIYILETFSWGFSVLLKFIGTIEMAIETRNWDVHCKPKPCKAYRELSVTFFYREKPVFITGNPCSHYRVPVFITGISL